MAIQLYRKGNTHTVRGIECELGNFSAREMDYQLNEGWVKDPSEIDNPVKLDTDQETEQKEVTNPVRLAAKEAGIDGWDTKRIKTLEALLSDGEKD